MIRQQQPTVIWWEQPETDSLLQIESIVVTPLENTSGDDSQDYFADVLTEALISELARVHKLKVFSGSVMAKHPSAGKALSSLAGELRVDMLVEGSVIRLSEPGADRRDGLSPTNSISGVVAKL